MMRELLNYNTYLDSKNILILNNILSALSALAGPGAPQHKNHVRQARHHTSETKYRFTVLEKLH